jgi:DNA-nicking Smr family endonuclease
MGRKKKKAKRREAEAAPKGAPKRISRPFAEALRGMKLEEEPAEPDSTPAATPVTEGNRPAKSSAATGETEPQRPEYSYEDRAAFNVAFADVAPLGSKKRRRRKKTEKTEAADTPRRVSRDSVDAAARAKLASLVAGGLRFELRREEGWIEGRREDAPRGRLADLRNGRATPESEIDLHGMTGDAAEKALIGFLRRERRRGRTIVRVIHGKGLHSEGGVGVLADRVVTAITRGNAGPLVHAFVTASIDGGGSGALLLRLETR